MEWYYVLLVLTCTYTESAIHESSALKLAKPGLIPKTSILECSVHSLSVYQSIYPHILQC